MTPPKVPYNPKQVTAFTPEEAATLSKSDKVLGGDVLDTTAGLFDASANSGLSASFLGDTAQSLEALNKSLTDRIEAGRATAEEGIRNQADITREEIQQNQAEGQRQISYAQERLGGAVILRRNVEDFTANVKKFTSEIDRSLERLDIEMNNALATNNNNAWNALFNLKKDAIANQLAMYDRAQNFYFENARLALQQFEADNQRLDTMLQWATLDNASEEELAKIAASTGFSVEQLRAMGATAQQTFNAEMAAKGNKGIVYPAALIPWQGSIDKALEAGASAEDAIQQAITDANDRGVKLSDADIASLAKYAQDTLQEAKAAAGALGGGEKGAVDPNEPFKTVFGRAGTPSAKRSLAVAYAAMPDPRKYPNQTGRDLIAQGYSPGAVSAIINANRSGGVAAVEDFLGSLANSLFGL